MVIISYIIKHIITNKNKILHKLFYALFAPYNKKKWKKYRICFRIHTEFYIYHLRKYRMNLRFTFYESLQAQCSKQEYKFVYKILYPIYSQSKKNDQKTDYRIITVSDRFQPYLGLFRYCTKLGAQWAELVQLMQKFMPRSRVGTFHYERTRNTPWDPKLMFCFIL